MSTFRLFITFAHNITIKLETNYLIYISVKFVSLILYFIVSYNVKIVRMILDFELNRKPVLFII